MARLSTYIKDVNLTGKDMLAGSNYVATVNGIDQFETNNFTLKKLSEYFIEQINIDPGNLPLKSNGGLVYETTLDTDYLAIDLSATNITGQLANSDLVNSSITINGTSVALGGSITIGEVSEVIAGTYLNGGGTEGTVTINHDDTSRSDTTSSPSQLAYDGTFTAITSVSTNSTGHLTAINTATYTLPSSDETNDYVDSIAVTGTTTKTITLGRTGALSDLTATFDDNDTIPNDATITLSAGTYISGGGDFTTDQSSPETIIFNHDNTTRTDTTSSVGPNHGADFTVIDTLTSNATGHITAANVKTVTLPNGANDNTITLSAGTYLSGGGDFTVDQSFDETLTINHDSTTRSDTTSTDDNNSHEDTFTVVDSISTNATGHVTGINVKTVSFPPDTNQDIDVNVSNLETRLGQIGNTSIGSSGSTITIPNLTVTGTQTINNVEVISTSSGIVFEGTSNDANETTLNVINPTADRAINLPNKSGTVALLDDIPTVNDGTLTVQGSSGLTGSGTFTANDADSPTITISHADTSSQSSVNNSGNTFIQDITVDTYGHITGITSGTATDNDTITQIREDNGSYRTGSITLQSGTNVNITEPSTGVFNFAATDTNTTYSAGGGLDLNGTVFSHTDTSSQSSVNNSGRTYIQDITLDTYGHVTGLTSATETVTDTNNYVTGASVSGTTTKTLTLTRQGLSNLTASWTDLDTNTDNYVDSVAVTGSTTKTITIGRTGSLPDLTASWTDIDTNTDNYVTGASVTGTATKTLTLTRSGGLSNITATWTDLDTNTDTNYYLNTASFNTSNGVLSLGVTGYGTVTVDLDGRYLTSYTETDTLDTVTGRNNSTSNNILVGDIFRNGATGFYLKLNNTGQAMRAAGQIEINNNDSGIILLSTNSSASNATQLQLYHNFGDVFFQNLRGNIQLVANGYTYTNSSFGVGTTPGVKLDVYDASTSVNIIRARNATQQIALGVNDGSGGAFLFVNSNHDLRFGTNGSEVGRFKTTGEFVVAQSTSDTNASIRIGGDNAPGGRLYFEYNSDSSYIDCYGGHGGAQRYRDLSIVSRNLYLKGNNNLGITVESTGKVNVGSSATIPTNIQLQTSGDIRINSNSGSLWIGGYNDSQAGRVRLHSANGAGYLDWEASSGTSSFIFRYDTSNRFSFSSGGVFTASSDIVAYGSPSDITLKENIKPIKNALDKVEKLQGVTFNWKEAGLANLNEDIGFIAQDVQKVLPELVRKNENGKLSLRHQGIVPVLLEAIKELSDKIKALENGSTE